MKRLRICVLLSLFSGVLAVVQARAHNNLFLPGDAYFSTRLGEGFPSGGEGDEPLTLEYHRFHRDCYNCGWAGYENLAVNHLDGPLRERLERVREILFDQFGGGALGGGDEGPPRHFPLFVYNKGFPLSHPFGLKFNEDWVDVQTLEAGMPFATYDAVGGPEFVAEDWRRAAEIAPLAIGDARRPMVRPDGETGIVREPLEIDAREVMFVALADGDLREYAERAEGLVFFVVTAEGARRYRFDRRGVAQPQPLGAVADTFAADRRAVARDQRLLRAALGLYAYQFGAVPSKAQGLRALVDEPEGAPAGWMPLLGELPADPWGNAYGWDGYALFSLGADGVESSDDLVEPFERATGAGAGAATAPGG